jgi:hypothetical protein
MPTDFPNNDFPNTDFPKNVLQNVWQNQPTEVFQMSANELRRKAQQHDRKARLAVLVSAAVTITLFLYFGWSFLSFPGKLEALTSGVSGAWSMRLGFGVLSLWGLYSGYKTYKALWPNLAASDAGLKTTVQSYRQQLEKRHDYSRNIWLRSGLFFCFLGMTMVIVPILIRDLGTSPRLLANVAPIFALLILWLAIFIPQRKRRQRKLEQEIHQLRAFEREA